MAKTTSELVRIAASGGGMTIDAKGRTTDELVRISAAGSGKKIRLTVKNAESRTTHELVRISAAGQGCVEFDFCE